MVQDLYVLMITAAVPCFNFIYNHASASLRAKIDLREQEVAAAEAETSSGDAKLADKARHAVRHTISRSAWSTCLSRT